MNTEEFDLEYLPVTPQERTGVKLLASFAPDLWVVVDGGHPAPLDGVGSGAGVVVLQQLSQQKDQPEGYFTINWQHYSYPLHSCSNSTDAEIWAAVKGLEQVAAVAGQKRIRLISDNSAVSTLQTKLLVIELGLKNTHRYAKEMETSPLRELADLFLRSQPCQIVAQQTLQPEGFNLVLLAAHQAAHELATKAAKTVRQQSVSDNSYSS